MATQENIKTPADSLNEASLVIGKAWGLAEILYTHVCEQPDGFDREGVARVVASLVAQARGMMGEGDSGWREISDALAVCDLVLEDCQDYGGNPNTPSVWALGALPEAIWCAKSAVDTASRVLLKVA